MLLRKRSLIAMRSWLGLSKYFFHNPQADEDAAKYEQVLQEGLDYIEEVDHVVPKYAEIVDSHPQDLLPDIDVKMGFP
jgi:hypothetical protein